MSASQQSQPILQRSIDLTTARTFVELFPPGTPISQIYIASLAAGTQFFLRFGVNNPPVIMIATGGGIFPTAILDGIYMDNTAQPGLVAIVTAFVGKKRDSD